MKKPSIHITLIGLAFIGLGLATCPAEVEGFTPLSTAGALLTTLGGCALLYLK